MLLYVIFVAISSGIISMLLPIKNRRPFFSAFTAAVIMAIGLFWILPATGWAGEKLPVFILSFIAFLLSQFLGLDSRRKYIAGV